jgi:AAA domain
MLDFNNAGPQRPQTGWFGGTGNDNARQASGGGLSPRPVAPDDYHMPPDIPAIAELCALKSWVCWAYALNRAGTKWTKQPKQPWQPRANASTSDPRTWGDFGQAVKAAMATRGIDGIGFVFTENDNLIGFDLDGVRDPATGEVDPWAQEIIDLSETYAELSPSGRGYHIIARGKLEGGGISYQPAQVEMYDRGRYFTFSGHHVAGTPPEIKPALRTMEALQARVQAFKQDARKKADKEQARRKAGNQPGAHASNDSFFRRVNDAALRDLETVGRWFTHIFPGAYQSSNGSWRASPEETGRDDQYEEDLTIGVNLDTGKLGIVDRAVWDMGDPRKGRRTPIDLVIEHGGAPDAVKASLSLCEQLGISPESLGWRDGTSSQARSEAFSQAEAADVTKWNFLSTQQPTAPRMLVDEMLPYRGIAFLGGQSGSGKTFVACDLALSLASSQPFFEHEVNERIGVAILSKEGTGNLANRLIAGAQARGLDLKDLPIAWRGDFPPIATLMDIQRVTEALASLSETIQAQYNVRCGAVIFDTVAASFAIDDENSNSEIGKISRHLREVEEKLDGLVIPIHHYGKSSTAGLRGGSLWKGTADVVLSTTCDKDETSGETKNRQLSIAKARDGKEGPIAKFELEFYELGRDDKGKPFGAMIVKPDFDAPTDGEGKKKRPVGVNQQRFIDAFNEAILAPRDFRVRGDGPTVKAVKLEYVRAEFYRRHVTGQTGLTEEDAGDIKSSRRRVADANRKAWQRQLENLPSGFHTATAPDGTEWIWRLPQ